MTIILASKSASRRAMLDAAGVPYTVQVAGVDERGIEAGLGHAGPDQVALTLARAKALAPEGGGKLVLGSDSLVSVEGRRFDKPASREDAADHLRFFSDRVIELHSAAAVVRDGEVLWDHAALARLHVRPLSESFIAAYLDAEWPDVSHCVGVFRMEAMGVQLFSAVEGDHFTVLGMPLLPVLGALRDLGALPA